MKIAIEKEMSFFVDIMKDEGKEEAINQIMVDKAKEARAEMVKH